MIRWLRDLLKPRKNVRIWIGYGEAIDRISILSLKNERIPDPVKLRKINREYMELWRILVKAGFDDLFTNDYYYALREVNGQLWCIENDIRALEALGVFGDEFIRLARSVYRLNDERSTIKRTIDEDYGCPTGEVKSYKGQK